MRWVFILLVFSLSCNRIEMDYYSVQNSTNHLDPISNLDAEGRRKDLLPTRSQQKQFQEQFVSSKLDMVFILDTHKSRKELYSKDFLGYDFLNYFYDYKWRLAWTDMSVDIKALQEETEKDSKTGSSSSNCGFFSNLLLTVGGVIANSFGATQFGLRGISNCLSKIDLRSNKKQNQFYANGSFLPFEYDKKTFYLHKRNEHSSAILYKSLTLPNPEEKTYKAPRLRESKSFPLLSLIFSLSKNLYTQSKHPFLREDSLVVFVLFSLEDSKISIPAEALKESLSSAFGSYDRFKLILVTLTDSSQVFCPLYHQESSKKPEKLIRLVEDLDQTVLDICSQDLGKEIFNEISKGLSSQNLI